MEAISWYFPIASPVTFMDTSLQAMSSWLLLGGCASRPCGAEDAGTLSDARHGQQDAQEACAGDTDHSFAGHWRGCCRKHLAHEEGSEVRFSRGVRKTARLRDPELGAYSTFVDAAGASW
eukprot:5883559-Amphidinium_carterae.2